MSLVFNILWFEDNDEWYETNRENIEEYLARKNFVADFKRHISADEIENISTLNEYDLIFVDLKLDNQTKGTNAIQILRDKKILADALFYSSDGVDKIRNEMGMNIFEGVYFSSRDEAVFEMKAAQLIDKAVRRTEDIISTRGILVDSLSEFDEKLREVILKFCSSYIETDVKKVEELDKYSYGLITKQMCTNQSKCDEMKKERFLLVALDSTYLVDSAKLAQIVQHIFNKHYPQHKYRKDFYNTYCKKIIKERNNLAHAKKEPNGDGLFFFEKGGDRIVYNEEKCSEIRASINEFDEEISKMIDLII
ncbi:MAG: hypothetical protein E7255_05970 [Lachnospiraceae bacterium]|jgi:CheY-like chemotaxis protein|nr:hypothetical protein [Lachnospiraceae bacterium]